MNKLDKNEVLNSYQNISKNLVTKNDRVFVTGGALILALADKFGFRYGNFDTNESVAIAGKEFSKKGLYFLWKFYSVVNFYGYTFACVDERLLPDTSESGIHEHCGAAAACAPVLGLNNGEEVEDFALEVLGRDEKQSIMEELISEHSSDGILISCGDFSYNLSDKEKTERLENVGSLPFHVSYPVEKIRLFAQNLSETEQNLFYKTLIDWNCGIILRIIAGDHNLRAQEVKTIGLYFALVDSFENDPLISNLKDGILENMKEIYGENLPQTNFINISRDEIRQQLLPELLPTHA